MLCGQSLMYCLRPQFVHYVTLFDTYILFLPACVYEFFINYISSVKKTPIKPILIFCSLEYYTCPIVHALIFHWYALVPIFSIHLRSENTSFISHLDHVHC